MGAYVFTGIISLLLPSEKNEIIMIEKVNKNLLICGHRIVGMD